MTYLISIILPIYNVENYLKSALESIINQTIGFKNLEVIMVDDCSDDDSGIIMDEYSEKYGNFISIHFTKNSGGAGKPRNEGLKYASSDLIMFLDPDDEFMSDACERLYSEFLNSNADIITGNAKFITKHVEIVDLSYGEDYYNIIPNKDLTLFKPFRIWGTLFKSSLIFDNNINFIDVETNEDTYFCYACFFKANNIIYLNDYFGVKHFERDFDEHISLSHKFNKKHIIGTINAFKKILILINDSNPNKDYIYDPFLLNIFVRFNDKWDVSYNGKKEIFNNILDYEQYSKYEFNLPIHFRFMNFLLNKHLFNTLILIQLIFAFILQSKLCKNLLIKFKINNIVG